MCWAVKRLLPTVDVRSALDLDNAATPSPATPALSPAASDLLIEASRDGQGVVMSLQTMEGASVQTNGKNFAERGNPRSEAQWRRAVEALSEHGLLEDRAGKGEIYFVTDQGYEMADRLKER
jgi:hypothetical protein